MARERSPGEKARLERLDLESRFRLAYNKLLDLNRVVAAEVLYDEWKRLGETPTGLVRIGRRELVWAVETLAEKEGRA